MDSSNKFNEHTGLPWARSAWSLDIDGQDNTLVARVVGAVEQYEARCDAAFIVEAANSYYPMKERITELEAIITSAPKDPVLQVEAEKVMETIWEWRNARLQCPTCQGKGSATGRRDEIDCRDCGGLGRVALDEEALRFSLAALFKAPSSPWISLEVAVPRDGLRVVVKDARGNEGFAIATWHPFTIHKGEYVGTSPQFSGFAVEADADLNCPVEGITHWQLPAAPTPDN